MINVSGCYFHGADSGHDDANCAATHFNPDMRNEWCECPSHDEAERSQFFVHSENNHTSHGWYCTRCKGLIQSG